MRFLIKKAGTFCLLIVGITFLSFVLSYLSPGDPAQIMLNNQGVKASEEALVQARHEMGLDQPMIVQYGKWLADFCKGDMGTSYKSNRPVVRELTEKIPGTMLLTVTALAVTMLLAIPLGTLCAWHANGWLDRLVRAVTYLFASLPSFFLALLLMYFLSLKLKMFNVIGSLSLKGLVMPVLTLALTLAAWYIRQVRAIILKELNEPYVEGLRGRGVSEKKIIFGHVLRNCRVSMVTLVGISFGSMLGGTTIVESIFSWPGVGKLAVDAITARDYPVIQGYVVWMAVIYLIINFVIELLYPLMDPRTGRRKEA
ncbi:MAG: nickel ABC transporter permease [Coprococcus sp.]